MATWEDGPEYAPRERPQYFADAPLPPLEQAPPPQRPADGRPAARPRFDEPAAPVAPLASLVPTPPDERDPSRPFDVVTATLTSESSWGSPTSPLGSAALTAPEAAPGTRAPLPAAGAPWPLLEPAPGQPPAPPYAQPSAPPYALGRPTGPGVPVGPPLATPSSPFPHAAAQGPYPQPGTPAWFTPPPTAYGDSRQPGRPTGREVFEAATPGLCISLALGGLIFPLAPVMVVVAVFLSMRARVAQAAVRMTLRVAAGAVAFFAVVGLVRSVTVGDPWWSFVSGWSVAICWISLVVVLLVVRQALTRPSTPPTTPWG